MVRICKNFTDQARKASNQLGTITLLAVVDVVPLSSCFWLLGERAVVLLTGSCLLSSAFVSSAAGWSALGCGRCCDTWSCSLSNPQSLAVYLLLLLSVVPQKSLHVVFQMAQKGLKLLKLYAFFVL